jgi:NAD(P)-dependent dehydrogenase (short-subunit alcohol dehydrogenase family)
MTKLAGKVAVVTGASQGSGARIAKALAAEGAAVIVSVHVTKNAPLLLTSGSATRIQEFRLGLTSIVNGPNWTCKSSGDVAR